MSVSSGDNRPIPNSYWVVPGRFAAGEYPGAKRPKEAADKLKTLLDAGIDHFIDLTEPGELVPYEGIVNKQAQRVGATVAWEQHPVVDLDVPRSTEQMAGILDAIDVAMNENKTVYLHCWGGVGRTGTVVGCWLVRHGCTGDEALRQIAEWWKGVEKAWRLPYSPQTSKQREYVRNWMEPSPGVELPI